MNNKKRTIFRFLSCLALLLCFLVVCSACSPVSSSASEEKLTAEKLKKQDEMLSNAVLQYPTKNTEFHYNVYDTHITITKYIGEGGDVTIPSEIDDIPVYVIGSEAFKESLVTTVTIEKGVLKINSSCFEKCTQLTDVKMPDTVYKIGEGAFAGCSSLTEIAFPELVSKINRSVCSGCTALKTVKIYASQKGASVGEYAFRGCESLTSIYMPKTVTKISSNAFSDLPEDVVFYGPAASATAQYCADKFYEYSVISKDDFDKTTETETSQSDTGAESGETENAETEVNTNESGGGSIWSLILIALVFFGIIGGLIAFLIIRKRRGY